MKNLIITFLCLCVFNSSFAFFKKDTIIKVEWKQISGDPVVIDSANKPKTKVNGFTKPGIYQFEFTVWSSNGLSSKDTMQVTVTNGALPISYIDITYSIVEKDEIIKWIVQGENITETFLQKSYDGTNFFDLQKIDPVGAIQLKRETKNAWFRIKSFSDQQEKKSKIIFIKGWNQDIAIWQYGSNCYVDSNDEGLYILYNASGEVLQKGFISKGINLIDFKNRKGMFVISIKTEKGISSFKAVVN